MAVVRQIDHLLIQTHNPDYLYRLFTETFQLPVVWPLAKFPGFVTGGVFFGNVNLETLRPDEQPAMVGNSARCMGIAFEPAGLEASLRQLAERQIAHAAPAPFESLQADGSRQLRWTNVLLDRFYADNMIFLCQYAFDIEARRSRNRAELEAIKGGPLGLQAVKEVLLGVTDLDAAQARWRNLLAPSAESERGRWQVGGGPAIRVQASAQDAIQGLVLKVASLEQARAFLADKGLVGSDSETMLTLSHDQTQGLAVHLVDV